MSLDQWFSKCGPYIFSINITWKLARNVNYQVPPKAYWVIISGGGNNLCFHNSSSNKGLRVTLLNCHFFSIPIDTSLFEILTVSHLNYYYGFQIGFPTSCYNSVECSSHHYWNKLSVVYEKIHQGLLIAY